MNKIYIFLAIIGISMMALGIYEFIWCLISPQGSRPIICLNVFFIGMLICSNKNINLVIKKIFS